GVQRAIGPTVAGPRPEKLSIRATAHQVDQRRPVIGGAKGALIEPAADCGIIVGVRVELGTQIEDAASFEQDAHRLRTAPLFASPRQQESFEDVRISRRRPRTRLSPVAIAVPGNKADQGVVHFLDESPDPVEPERLKAIHAGPAYSRSYFSRPQPLLNSLRNHLINVAIAFKGEPAIRPRAVRLVADAPK